MQKQFLGPIPHSVAYPSNKSHINTDKSDITIHKENLLEVRPDLKPGSPCLEWSIPTKFESNPTNRKTKKNQTKIYDTTYLRTFRKPLRGKASGLNPRQKILDTKYRKYSTIRENNTEECITLVPHASVKKCVSQHKQKKSITRKSNLSKQEYRTTHSLKGMVIYIDKRNSEDSDSSNILQNTVNENHRFTQSLVDVNSNLFTPSDYYLSDAIQTELVIGRVITTDKILPHIYKNKNPVTIHESLKNSSTYDFKTNNKTPETVSQTNPLLPPKRAELKGTHPQLIRIDLRGEQCINSDILASKVLDDDSYLDRFMRIKSVTTKVSDENQSIYKQSKIQRLFTYPLVVKKKSSFPNVSDINTKSHSRKISKVKTLLSSSKIENIGRSLSKGFSHTFKSSRNNTELSKSNEDFYSRGSSCSTSQVNEFSQSEFLESATFTTNQVLSKVDNKLEPCNMSKNQKISTPSSPEINFCHSSNYETDYEIRAKSTGYFADNDSDEPETVRPENQNSRKLFSPGSAKFISDLSDNFIASKNVKTFRGYTERRTISNINTDLRDKNEEQREKKKNVKMNHTFQNGQTNNLLVTPKKKQGLSQSSHIRSAKQRIKSKFSTKRKEFKANRNGSISFSSSRAGSRQSNNQYHSSYGYDQDQLSLENDTKHNSKNLNDDLYSNMDDSSFYHSNHHYPILNRFRYQPVKVYSETEKIVEPLNKKKINYLLDRYVSVLELFFPATDLCPRREVCLADLLIIFTTLIFVLLAALIIWNIIY